MITKILLFHTAFALFSAQVFAQTEKPVQRRDSVTVSAGIPKEQLALEEQLNAMVDQGNQELRRGRAADAIKEYESALELVQKQPLLAERKNYVLDNLAKGYIQGDRARDAIPIYSQLLAARRSDCESQSASISNCADAQFNLGMAKLHAKDFEGALATLRDAEANYIRAEKVSELHEFSAIQVKEQAQTNLWIAVALSQLGKSEEARTCIEAAIPLLIRVKSDESILVGIRDDAARSLQNAQGFLERLKTGQ
jgi:tetratricopeptide (TPR) repeat protein